MRQIIARWSHATHEQVPLDESEDIGGIQIVKDIEPYQSMITGERIASRAHHRIHLRDHNCIEVGNEKMESKPVMKREARSLLRHQLRNMTDSHAGQILQTLDNMSRR